MKRKPIVPHRLHTDPRMNEVGKNAAYNDSILNFLGKETVLTSDPEVMDLPTFPDSVFENLPAFLQKVLARCDSIKGDLYQSITFREGLSFQGY